MKKFDDLLNYFRDCSLNERNKGDMFEKFIKKFFQTEPTYSNQYEKIWLWSEFPFRNNMPDTGIDLVAKMRNSEDYSAIQCKFYDENSSLPKAGIDSFLSTSSKSFIANGRILYFAERIIISTTDKWSKNALDAIQNQIIPVTRIRLQDFKEMAIDWDSFDIENIDTLKRSVKKHLLPHQEEALNDVLTGYEKNTRGKLIMACGTGKTFTSLKIVEKITHGKGIVVFFVPSISLLNQTLIEWSAQSEYSFNMLAICSDAKATKNKDDIVDTVIPATTDINKLKQFYSNFDKEKITFVFSTYQSIDVVTAFQNAINVEFDIVVCDEAHRTTGVKLSDEDESSFTKVHYDKYIQSKKRLYMTATPRVYSDDSKNKAEEASALLCSMDDEEIYGPVFHTLGFGKAVEKGLLSDYKVIVLTVSEEYISESLQKLICDENNELNLEDSVKIVGCWNGLSKIACYEEDKEAFSLDPEPMKTAVAFCNTIKNSKSFKEKFEMIETYYKTNNVNDSRVDISIEHVDGQMNSFERKEKIDWLKKPSSSKSCKILTNARCLSEGIDVPSLDAVMFLSPRNSIIDIIQSVGRVMRRPYDGNKKYGYIILPIGIPAGVEPEKALNDNKKYKVVWDVLQALRAHDDRFNNTINKIDLNKKKPGNISIIGVGYGDDDQESEQNQGSTNKAYKKMSLDLDMQELKDQVYAKIVKKCGSRQYWETWAKDIAEIAQRHITQIKTIIQIDDNKIIFNKFVKGLRNILNPSISEDDAIEMLAEHMITKPVFDALFDNYSFVKNNPVSKTMQEMLDLLDKNALVQDQKTLEKFYESVKERASGVDNSAGKQKIIIELYDKFFTLALKKQVEKLGIVYTPTEVVDFIINSVEVILNKNFNKSLGDENVHILDPFTGTGTFIVRLLQNNIISRTQLLNKYQNEIHANEIVLLAYYIAAINIEEAFHEIQGGEYIPFEGIVLTDTFELSETKNTSNDVFKNNSDRAQKQLETPIQVIIANPPYNVGQNSANDNNANIGYPFLDASIANTYVKYSKANNKNSLYDSYIRAFRWATDRIGDKGVIGFVTNGSYIDNQAMSGFRKCLVEEFNSIYCFNLRGNCRTSGELRKQEAGNVFGGGSRTPIAITLVSKNSKEPKDGYIHYYDIGDYLSREEKLSIIKTNISIKNMDWDIIYPDENNDWINIKNPKFDTFIKIGDKKNKDEISIFSGNYAMGLNTARDAWLYNYDSKQLQEQNRFFVENYNNEVDKLGKIFKEYKSNDFKKAALNLRCNDPKLISWSSKLDNYYFSKKYISYEYEIVSAMYRPFCKTNLYRKDELIHRGAFWGNIFPNKNFHNLVICISSPPLKRDFSVMMCNVIADMHMLEQTQCFPLYWYEKEEAYSLFSMGEDDYSKRINLNPKVISKFRDKYGEYVSEEDVFYYIFAILNSKKFINEYKENLMKDLVRIPMLNYFNDYVKIGKEIADLELNYENIEISNKLNVNVKSPNYYVNQMKFEKSGKTIDKTKIIVNPSITIENIPMEAYSFMLNGKSAIEWVMERESITVDKDSQIKNDCNKYSKDNRYVLDLLLKVITISEKIVNLINSLPDYEEI